MPTGGESGWYLPVLIVGSVLAAFLLGVVVTIWLGKVPLSATPSGPPLAQIASNGPTENGTSLPDSTLANTAQAQTTQSTAGEPAQPTAQPSPNVTESVASPASAPNAGNPGVSHIGEYSLQLGAFLDTAKGKLLAAELAARGFTPALIDAADGNGRDWHYVRLGAFPDEDAADRAAADLLVRTGIAAAVIRSLPANARH